MNELLEEKNVKEIEKKSTDIVVQAQALVVTTEEEYAAAVEFGKTIKDAMKEVEDVISPVVKKAHEAHKSAKALETKLLAPFKTAIDTVKQTGAKYQAEKARIAQIEQARIDALAKKSEEEEKQRLLDLAAEQEKEGNKEVAEALLEQAEEHKQTATIIAPEKSKVAGSSVRKQWKFEIVNANLVPRQYLMVNETLIGQTVRNQKDTISIPGVRIYSVDQVAF